MMTFPTLLEMEPAEIYAYSIETVISEKLEAIVSLGYVNSRYKDFYDIYILCKQFNFNGDDLSKAIESTFEHRKTQLDEIVAFDNEFIEDRIRVLRWNSFVKKKRAMEQVEFKDVIELIKLFLSPVIASIGNNESYKMVWNANKLSWSEN